MTLVKNSGTRKLLVMLGTSPDAHGGIASVVSGYKDAGLFERWNIRYLTTHVQAGVFRKFAVAISAWCSLLKFLVRVDVALIHVHMSSRASTWRKFFFVALAFMFSTPYVIHMHGGNYIDFYRRECGLLGRLLVRWMLRKSARVIVLSAGWRDEFISIEPQTSTLIVHNFVQVPDEKKILSDRVADVPLNLLFLGRLTREKGAFDSIRAVANLDFEFRLVFGGEGDVASLRGLADSFGISDKIFFPGWVDGINKEKLLSQAMVFVLPSHFEWVPVAILEAMAWGLPVVSTSVGGIPEVVGPAEGILVQAGDIDSLSAAISSLHEDKSKRVAMGAAGRSRVAMQFSKASTIFRIEELWSAYGVARAPKFITAEIQ